MHELCWSACKALSDVNNKKDVHKPSRSNIMTK